jgi:hypothetical protein
MRAVIGRPTAITVTLADAFGNATQADLDTPVTIDVVDGAGTPIVTAATATDEDQPGRYSYILAPRDRLDVLAVTWHATVGGYAVTMTDTVRLVGDRILSPADIDADDVLAALDPTRRSFVLETVEDLLSDILGFPVVPESARLNMPAMRQPLGVGSGIGTTSGTLFSGYSASTGGERFTVPGISRPLRLYSLTVDNVAVPDGDLGQIEAGDGFFVWRNHSWPTGNYELWLTHGLAWIPADLRQAAATLARYTARRIAQAGKTSTLLPERTASLTTEGGTIIFAVPTPDRPTGLPEVDAVLVRYRGSFVI